MSLKKTQLAAAVAKYKEYKDNGFTANEISEEIRKDEAEYKDADIAQIVDAIMDIEDEPQGETGTPVNTSTGINIDFEEWQVEAERDQKYHEDGSKSHVEVTGFRQLKKLRTTRVSQRIADEINSQSLHSGIRLYPVEK